MRAIRDIPFKRTAALVAITMLAAACSSSEDAAPVENDLGAQTSASAAVSVAAQPEDNGQALLSAIESATNSVDISIYELNGPHINKALADALDRGVDVRILYNGQWWQESSDLDTATKAIESGDCSQIYSNNVAGICNAVVTLAQHDGEGSFGAFWSNENFNITHQKTAIIDAMDSSGNALDAGSLPATAKAIVMTGNLSAYGYGSDFGCGKAKDPMTDPSCVEWSARDFYLTVTDPTEVATIAAINASDRSCPSRTTTNDLRNADGALTWSNGSTGVNSGDASDEYPVNGNYPFFPSVPTSVDTSPSTDPGPGTNQGNVRQRTLEVIDGATKTLIVYNEEMADTQIVEALKKKAGEIDTVRVLMTQQSKAVDTLTEMQAAGVEVRLFGPDQVYIHAKVILADDSKSYVGSTNISSYSLNYNRELGLMVEDSAAIDSLTNTFESDWAQGGPIPPTTTTTSTTAPAQAGPETTPDDLRAASSGTNAPFPCGAMKLPAPTPPTTASTNTTQAPAS